MRSIIRICGSWIEVAERVHLPILILLYSLVLTTEAEKQVEQYISLDVSWFTLNHHDSDSYWLVLVIPPQPSVRVDATGSLWASLVGNRNRSVLCTTLKLARTGGTPLFLRTLSRYRLQLLESVHEGFTLPNLLYELGYMCTYSPPEVGRAL